MEKTIGSISVHSQDASTGIVNDAFGNIYTFHSKDWLGHISELANDTPVEFVISSGRAIKVAYRSVKKALAV